MKLYNLIHTILYDLLIPQWCLGLGWGLVPHLLFNIIQILYDWTRTNKYKLATKRTTHKIVMFSSWDQAGISLILFQNIRFLLYSSIQNTTHISKILLYYYINVQANVLYYAAMSRSIHYTLLVLRSLPMPLFILFEGK